jgi:adenosylcobinamide-GDP ribazoletransferase
MMVMHMALLPSARPDGLGALFCAPRPLLSAIWAAVACEAVAWFLFGARGIAAWGAVLALTLLVAAYLHRKLGGVTGDTFGALCEIVEAATPLFLTLWLSGGRS